MGTQKQSELTDYALTLVHHKAWQLVGKAGYLADDVADIKQDLIVALLERLPRFDPARASYNTYVDRVVASRVVDLLRRRNAEMRDHRREAGSLNAKIDTGGGKPVQRLATISRGEQYLRTGKHTRSARERARLRFDTASVLDSLTPELRRGAEMLQTKSVSQVARELVIPRSTFCDNHLAQLREAFAAKGMADYLR
jgi:RNA polymerase sigma-70 factor (ECF subfamily)